jgi:hypothetical protein
MWDGAFVRRWPVLELAERAERVPASDKDESNTRLSAKGP